MREETDATGRSALVPGYAGHADARAWVGEIFTDLWERVPANGWSDRIERSGRRRSPRG